MIKGNHQQSHTDNALRININNTKDKYKSEADDKVEAFLQH